MHSAGHSGRLCAAAAAMSKTRTHARAAAGKPPHDGLQKA